MKLTETQLAVMRRAREIYAAAPSHADPGVTPDDGTYCAVTACSQARREHGGRYFVDSWGLLDDHCYSRHHMSVVRFNATHSTDEVLALFDEVLAC